MRAPFALEPYLIELRDRTVWAPDCAIEDYEGPRLPRAALYRVAHLWALALLDDRFEDLLLPVLVTDSPLLNALGRGAHGLSREFFAERLESGACLLLIDGPDAEAGRWPRNLCLLAE